MQLPRGVRLGPVLKAARQKQGWTQKIVAEQVNSLCGTESVTSNDVYRWESGRRSPEAYIRELVTVLDLNLDALLRAAGVTLPVEGVFNAPSIPSPTMEDDVDRRQFTGAGIGALAAVPLATVPAYAEDSGGKKVGESDVHGISRRLSDLRRLDDYTGGANTFPLAKREFDRVDGLLKKRSHATPAVQTELLRVLAEVGQFTAWTAFDAGQWALARQYAQRASRAANQGGDYLLAASTLSEMAYLTASSGSAKEAVDMSRAAWANAPRTALPAARALLADRWAFACARLGDVRGTERALALSQAAHDARDGGQWEEPDWLYWINREESQIMVGRCWAELHDHKRAVPVLEKVTAPYEDTHAREVALYEVWLAGSYLDARDVDGAISSATRAVDLMEQTDSPRTERWVDGVLQRLKTHPDVAPVRALLERTTTV